MSVLYSIMPSKLSKPSKLSISLVRLVSLASLPSLPLTFKPEEIQWSTHRNNYHKDGISMTHDLTAIHVAKHSDFSIPDNRDRVQ